ncbi:MAG: 30S ribosomal protein S6 [Saprospiraceae bacterium]|nr:30S ribosomal protein S6 [Saprospiraceae bacterium]
MRQFEVTFIVDPVLSGDEVKSTAKTYQDIIVNEGGNLIHVDEIGLKPLAYSINKRSTGVYYCIEFAAESGSFIAKLELALKRDERIMRFLTVRLDKFGIKYNEDKRTGKIGKRVPKEPTVKKSHIDTIPYQAFVSDQTIQEVKETTTNA